MFPVRTTVNLLLPTLYTKVPDIGLHFMDNQEGFHSSQSLALGDLAGHSAGDPLSCASC